VLGRRRFLQLSAFGAGALGVGALGVGAAVYGADARTETPAELDYIRPSDPEVVAAEQARSWSGQVSACTLAAAATTVDLGGRLVDTWSYGGRPVAPELRAKAGDRLQVSVHNELPTETTLHWHGIRIRNDMDGAAPTTQPPIGSGQYFEYSFVATDPGTYWYHSHSGLQADRGLFGALVVEDPHDGSGADADAVLVLDDWLDGLGTTPDAVLAQLNPAISGGHREHGGGSASPIPSPDSSVAQSIVAGGHGSSIPLGGMTQHIDYPLHLINGRPPNDPAPILAAPGTRLRLRIINAGA
jgi:FtsP/CotA-like multicopper oxidase with cupredoxin domain